MENFQDKIFLERLDDLFLIALLKQDDEDILEELQSNPDPGLDQHLNLIKRLNTQAKAKIQQSKQQKIFAKIELIVNNLSDYAATLTLPQYSKLNVFFSNYNEMSKEDKNDIIMDNLLLDLLDEIDNND